MLLKGIVHGQQKRFLALTIPIVLLLSFFALCLQLATTKSPTADEGQHILRGAVLWQTGDLSLQGNHLPFSHWLIGSLLFSEPTLPDVTQLPSWSTKMPIELGQDFMWQSGVVVNRIVFLGRLPIIFVAMFLGAVLARWSRRQAGLWGLAIVMVLFAFSPNTIALASLATTDLVTVAMILFALIFTWIFFQEPTAWRWVLAATTLGLALSTKLSSGIVLPTTFIMAYLVKGRKAWWHPAVYWLSLMPLAGLVVWGLYGFEFGPVQTWPLSLPAPTYVDSVLSITNRFATGKSAYLLGERSMHGWYYYFVVAFLVKTPSITLILLLVAVIYTTIRHRWRATTYLWLPALVLFGAASFSRFNIGYRHILILLPLSWLLVAETADFWQENSKRRWILAFGLLLYVSLTIHQQPNQLAFFNQFIGGSDQGMRFLGDSNIDWGQDLYRLTEYAENLDNQPLYISYFGASDLSYYGLSQEPLFDTDGNPTGFAPANPSPGHYAISVNHLQGATANEPDLFNWFAQHQPVETLGFSILIFDVPTDLDGDWIAHCYDPVPLIDERDAEVYVGREDLRHVYFDCHTSWVIPGGEGGGWFFIPAAVDLSSIDQDLAANLMLVYENTNSPRYQPFSVYYWQNPNNFLSQMESRQGAATFRDGTPVQLPLEVPGIAKLEGSMINQRVWGTIWQALAPSELPISVMLHLYALENAPIVADGLGFQPAQWQPGDHFIQFYDFGEERGSYLETSLYDFTSGDRYSFKAADGTRNAVRFYPPAGQ